MSMLIYHIYIYIVARYNFYVPIYDTRRWIKQFKELMTKYVWVQIFENKGAVMGCSNPHPHCQIWACSFMPNEPKIKDQHLRDYHRKYGRPMLDDYVEREIRRNERVVINNPDWLVVVPYWATWPFETMLISKNRNKSLADLQQQQINNLSIVIKELTIKYDNLFHCSFPYSMGWHGKLYLIGFFSPNTRYDCDVFYFCLFTGAPTGPLIEQDSSHWTLHACYYPPLLRSATVRKFMVGFELLCQMQRDLTAEQAAERLRQMDGKRHYTDHL